METNIAVTSPQPHDEHITADSPETFRRLYEDMPIDFLAEMSERMDLAIEQMKADLKVLKVNRYTLSNIIGHKSRATPAR